MPWEETEQYIRSGHRSPDEFQEGTFRTITLSEEEGIKAIIAKPKGKDTTEIQSYLFDKSKGWTLDKAKAWFEAHVNEKLQFIVRFHTKRERINEKKIRGIAAYPGISGNKRLYLPEELMKANGVQVPLYWEHDYSKPPLGIAILRWNPQGYLEYEAEYEGPDAPHVSIGAEYDYGEYFHDYFVPRNLKFYELSLTSNPGFPLTNVVFENRRVIEHVMVGKVDSPVTNSLNNSLNNSNNFTNNPQTTQTEVVNATSGVGLPQTEEGEKEEKKKEEVRERMSEVKKSISEVGGESEKFIVMTEDQLKRLIESLKPKEEPKPTAPIENEEQKRITEAKKRYQKIAESLKGIKETIDSSGASVALAQLWQPDLLVLPAGIKAKLRKYCEVVEIPKGYDRVHFIRITTPSFSALTEGVAPSDVTHTIDRVTATPVERGAKQTITYTVLESITGDIVEAIEKTLVDAAILDEDGVVLSTLDAATGIAATIYGGDATSEATIDSNDKINADLFSRALKEILEEGYDGEDLVAVIHPKQYQDLLQDETIKTAMQFGALSNLEEGVVAKLYGIDIVISTKVPTGSGSGSPPVTTYHGFVFKKEEAVGLGISRNLTIETERRTDERKLYITATHRIAAAVKAPKAVVKIITA
ncbi:MAG: phage capsid protein [Nitrososphaerota archaeon]|nr:phage capsid protein [Nitrososphaerota archaeon]